MINPLRESVQRISEAEVIVFSPPQIRTPVFISCQNGNVSKSYLVSGLEHFHLGPSCEISTPHFLFKAIAQLKIEVQFITRRLILLEKIQFRIEQDKIKQVSPFAPISQNHNNGPHQVGHIIAISVAITIVLILTGGIVFFAL